MAELNDDFISIQEGGDVRKLCARPVDDDTPTPTASHTFGETPTTRLIPRNEWQPVDLSAFVSPIKDQNGIGACNAFATVNALEACRRMKGLPDVRLSPGDLYSRINGGRDNGSLPEDALKTMLASGVATAATVPELQWRAAINTEQTKAERSRFRFTEALWCPTFDHVASALQQGFFIDGASWWYGHDPLDGDGWLAGRGSGSKGGHAYMLAGLVNRSGKWGCKVPNTWSRAWGRDGWCVAPEERLAEGSRVFRLWAVREVVQESGDLPTPKFGA